MRRVISRTTPRSRLVYCVSHRCEKPQIAIAVILENGGWGATAAPLARQLERLLPAQTQRRSKTRPSGRRQNTLGSAQTVDNPLLASQRTGRTRLPANRFRVFRRPMKPHASHRHQDILPDNRPRHERRLTISKNQTHHLEIRWTPGCFYAMLAVYIMSLFLLYSADGQQIGQLENKTLHTVLALCSYAVVASPVRVRRLSPNFRLTPMYAIGVILLLGRAFFRHHGQRLHPLAQYRHRPYPAV
jgi:hypothetical protein